MLINITSRSRKLLYLAVPALFLGWQNFAAADTTKAEKINFGFLAFGDSGYSADYLKTSQYNPQRKTRKDFVLTEFDDWVEDFRNPNRFKITPHQYVERVSSYVESSGLHPVANAMKSICQDYSCEFSLMLGDNIYPDGATLGADGVSDEKRFDDLFSKPFGDMSTSNAYKIYTILGNHDWYTSREGAMAQVKYMEQNEPFYMDGLFYTVKPPAGNGDVELFFVDTEVMLAGTTVLEADLNPDGSEVKTDEVDAPLSWTVPANEAERNMVQWLDDKLKASTAKWKLVIGHHPIWSTGGSKFEQAKSLRKLILPTLCQYADIYFAGHDHTLELHEDKCEGYEKGPLLQVLSGAASKQRDVHEAFKAYQTKNNAQLNTIYTKGMAWGFSHVQLRGDTATVKMFTTPNSGNGAAELDFTYKIPHRTK